MERIKNIALCLFLAVFAVLLFKDYKGCKGDKVFEEADTLRVVVYDTIPYYKPEPKEEKPLGNITAKLPVSVPKSPENVQKFPDLAGNMQDSVPNNTNYAPNYAHNKTEIIPDSAEVVVPITQTVYEDSTYTAYVSGYRASLDSLIFRMPREVTTITNTHYQKPKRWSVGIQVGYGMTLKGTPQFAPYVGIGVSYNLFSF